MILPISQIFAAMIVFTFVAFLGTSSHAETKIIESRHSVPLVMEKLKNLVSKSGAKIFTMIDYEKGAASVGKTIRPTSLIIFGNPKIGAGAFTVGQTIGLYLPLRTLAFEDEVGKVRMMYSDPKDAAIEHNIPADHPAIISMQRALEKLTKISSGY